MRAPRAIVYFRFTGQVVCRMTSLKHIQGSSHVSLGKFQQGHLAIIRQLDSIISVKIFTLHSQRSRTVQLPQRYRVFFLLLLSGEARTEIVYIDSVSRGQSC